MRAVLIAAAVALAACTPRDNRDSDLELKHSPEAAVHGEPTVTGGAYDSIIYRVEREGGVPPAPDSAAVVADTAPAEAPVRVAPDTRPGAAAELDH
jgi:hypothetical protein